MVSKQEAQQFCEQRGISPVLSQSERLKLSPEDFTMWAWAYSTSDSTTIENQIWAEKGKAETARRIAQRTKIDQLRTAASQ